jgi:hypothetical protein
MSKRCCNPGIHIAAETKAGQAPQTNSKMESPRRPGRSALHAENDQGEKLRRDKVEPTSCRAFKESSGAWPEPLLVKLIVERLRYWACSLRKIRAFRWKQAPNSMSDADATAAALASAELLQCVEYELADLDEG